MTPRQASKDQHRLKEKIEKERNINCRRKRNWRKRKGSKEKDDGKGSRKARCLIEDHQCLVAFVYESDKNVVSQRLVEKVQLPTSFHPNQARIKFSTGQCVKEVLCCSYGTELYFTSLEYYLGAERSSASSGFRGLWSQRRCACKRHSDAKVSVEWCLWLQRIFNA